ncbi:MAG: putative Ig domain-containing protein [Planctomycetota bacterium]
MLIGDTDSAWFGAVLSATADQTFEIVGAKRQHKGTMLLCSFAGAGFPSTWTRVRVRAAVDIYKRDAQGNEIEGSKRRLPATELVTIGRPTPAILWTAVFLIAALAVICLLGAKATSGRPGRLLWFLADAGGRMSLSRTQVALFTIAIGGLVFGYALFMPEVPGIPPTLLFLMGISLATGGASSLLSPPAKVAHDRKPRLSDLVTIHKGETEHLSIARTQMLFWTLLTVILFVVLSIADDRIWDVPWQMVGLMGLSSAGYLSAKRDPPKSLDYPTPHAFTAGKDDQELKPKFEGGAPQEFAIDPDLPTGLVLNPSTGEIRGRPDQKTAAKNYTVTGKSATGTVKATICISVT